MCPSRKAFRCYSFAALRLLGFLRRLIHNEGGLSKRTELSRHCPLSPALFRRPLLARRTRSTATAPTSPPRSPTTRPGHRLHCQHCRSRPHTRPCRPHCRRSLRSGHPPGAEISQDGSVMWPSLASAGLLSLPPPGPEAHHIDFFVPLLSEPSWSPTALSAPPLTSAYTSMPPPLSSFPPSWPSAGADTEAESGTLTWASTPPTPHPRTRRLVFLEIAKIGRVSSKACAF